MSFLRNNASIAALIVVSVAIHVGTLAVMPAGAATTAAPPPTTVEMEVIALPPPKPPEAAPIEPPAAPQARTVLPARRIAAARPVAPKATPKPAPPPAAETPADFTGVTLTNDGPGAGWSSPTGNGEQITRPIGTPGAEVTGRSRNGSPGGTTAPVTGGGGERVVGVGDLSRAPSPPSLDAALAAHYPADARAAGLAGRARVRVRIHADGRVGAMRVLSESSAGFGDACVATLRGSRWVAPLDAAGQSVATDVAYTCAFEVGR